MQTDARRAIAAEFATEISKQLLLYNEQAKGGDEDAMFMIKAFALKTADSALHKIAAPAFIWSFGLVDIVEQVAHKYAAQPASDRLEWWHHVLTGVVRSDVEVAIRSVYTSGVTLIMRCVDSARPVASVGSALLSLILPSETAAAVAAGAVSLDAILAFVSANGAWVQFFLDKLNRCALRCVLNVLLKSAKARPSREMMVAHKSTAATKAKSEACNFGVVLKNKVLLAFNNVVLIKRIAQKTSDVTKAALDFVLPDAKIAEWEGRSWSVYRMLVMQIHSTGGPESMRRKLGDPNATLLFDVARTLRASSIVSTSEFLVTFLMKELGAKGSLDLARAIARLALLYTFIECGNHERPFWEREESVMERAAMVSDSEGDAECVLGRMYHYGHGKTKDMAKAADLYRRAISAAARVNVTHAPALRGLAELQETIAATNAGWREVSEANLVSFAARRYLEEALGVPLTTDTEVDGLILRAALEKSALFESATEALIAHYELIADKQGWYGEKAAVAAKRGTMAQPARSGLRLWHQFVLSAQCDRIVETHIRRELLSIPESDILGNASVGLSEYVATMCDLLTSACLFGIRTCRG